MFILIINQFYFYCIYHIILIILISNNLLNFFILYNEYNLLNYLFINNLISIIIQIRFVLGADIWEDRAWTRRREAMMAKKLI